jgi:hypothetical protein
VAATYGTITDFLSLFLDDFDLGLPYDLLVESDFVSNFLSEM